MADSDGPRREEQRPRRRSRAAHVSVGVLLLVVLVLGAFGIRGLARDLPAGPESGNSVGPIGITKPDRLEVLRQVRALRDDLVAGRITIDWPAEKTPGSSSEALTTLESLEAALLSPDMIVFVKDGADGRALARLVASWSEVESASLVSKEETLTRLKEDLKDHQEILIDSLVSNPLPDSVEVLLHDASTAPAVEARLHGEPGVDEVRYRSDNMQATLKTLQMLQNLARPAGPNDTVASPTTALTKVRPLSAAVPKGRLLEETERMSSPSVAPSEHRFLIDYTGRRMRFEGYVDGVLRFLDVNEGGSTASLSTFHSSLRVHAGSFDEYEKPHDFLAGLPLKRVNAPSVDGQPADVYRVEFPKHGGEITAEYALIYVDKSTGLRFREEWMVGQEVVREVIRRLVASTQELEALLSRASVQASSVGGLESGPG